MELIEKIFLSSIVTKATTFRIDLKKALVKNDFIADTYENIGREETAEKGLGGQDECLLMMKQFKALVAILDLDPGTNYLGTELGKYKHLLPNNVPLKISVTMAEILYAKYVLNIPTIIMAMPGLFNQFGSDDRLSTIASFVNFLNTQPNNYIEREVYSVDDAIGKINRTGWCPLNRMKLLGNALSGPNWNGVDYFDDTEITIRNNLHPNLDALRILIKDECRVEKRVLRLRWLITHLNKFADIKLDDEEIEFLEEYIHRYAGFYKQKPEQRVQIEEENIANELMMRLPFGNNKIFGGYEYSRKGRKYEILNWPTDAIKWTAQGRIEFILYALQMENMPPKRLNAIADFNAANEYILGKGFTAHYSRKSVTIGCQNAANVRLTRNKGARKIDVKTEMKSMLYLTFTGTRYCLIGVHVNGNLDVDEQKVLEFFADYYNTKVHLLELVKHQNLLDFLEKIDSPLPKKLPQVFYKLSKYGAQEMISLFASSINPVSIFMSVRYKYEYILTKYLTTGFDCLMLWDNTLLELNEVYNNAGSPTWGMRFNPNEMYNHILRNTFALEEEFANKNLKIKYKMTTGTFSKPKDFRDVVIC